MITQGAYTRLAEENELLREFAAEAVESVHRSHARDGFYSQFFAQWRSCPHPYCQRAADVLGIDGSSPNEGGGSVGA